MAGLEMVIIASGAMVLVGFVCFLLFCAFVVVRTGGTAGLRDVAIAVRAFAFVGRSLRVGPRFPQKSGEGETFPAALGLLSACPPRRAGSAPRGRMPGASAAARTHSAVALIKYGSIRQCGARGVWLASRSGGCVWCEHDPGLTCD